MMTLPRHNQDRDNSSSFVVEAEVACRLLLKPTLGLQKVRDRDSAVLELLLYICIATSCVIVDVTNAS